MTGRCAMLAVLGAAGLLIAACGSSGGSGDVPPPTGPGSPTGTRTSATAHTSSSAHAGTSGTASATTHNRTTTAARPGGGGGGAGGGGNGGGGNNGGGHTSTHPAHHSTSKAPNTCTSSHSPGAAITICPGRGLHDGQQVKIVGRHFKPNEQLLAMQCDYKGETANDYGANDCTINPVTFQGAVQTKSDANGNVGPVYVPVQTTFKSINCTRQQCMITVAVPLQSGNADNPHALIYFG